MQKKEILDAIKGGLIVSCQALPEEPLHSSKIMARMAYAAKLGGASGIRANSCADIMEIKKAVDLPVICIIKKVFEDSLVYITPTLKEVDALAACGAEIIATDATNRPRPKGTSLEQFFELAKAKHPDILFMADCSTYDECMQAQKLGFDMAGTTLCGYTEYTKGTAVPNFDMMKALGRDLSIPLIAEGNIWTPSDLVEALSSGAFAAVIGTAITRPREITRRFVTALKSAC